jgi:type II secretory pathway component PulF
MNKDPERANALSKMFGSLRTSIPKRIGTQTGRGNQILKQRRPALLRFPIQDQILLAKRLGMILRSGMPIMEGLHMLSEGKHTRSSKFIFESITFDVSHGQPLSSGLAKFDRIFGDFCINIVRVGETSGTLHENLDYLAEELKKKQTLKRKVVGALIYPALIVVATLGIAVMLTVYIFPKIIPIFQSVKADLPFSTRLLITLSEFLSHWGLLLLAGIVVGIVAFIFLLRIPRFHYAVDALLLRIPLFGKLSQFYNLSNISRTLALLLKSDVRIVPSVELVAASTRNLLYRQALLDSRERLIKGQKMSMQFKAEPRLFPPLFTQMVTVSEATGNLSGSLMYISALYEEEINELTKNLTTLIEPILMVVMGLVVGFIAISIITPIYSITQNLNPHP